MAITVENIPYLSLIWTGLGFAILILGIFMIAHQQADPKEYTEKLEGKEDSRIEELFSFFLQEQEQKNDVLRNTVLSVTQNVSAKEVESQTIISTKQHPKQEVLAQEILAEEPLTQEPLPQEPKKTNEIFEKIIDLYNKENSPEEIAKELKMGIGEVQLILSLYTMR